MSVKSPGFMKWWPRCITINNASALQSQKACQSLSNAYLPLSHSELSTSLNLNSYPFKCQCPVDNVVIILRWFLLKLSNSPALLVDGLWRKPLAWLCPWMDCQYSLCFLLIQFLITALANSTFMCTVSRQKVRFPLALLYPLSLPCWVCTYTEKSG
jgi:hypothetical protein